MTEKQKTDVLVALSETPLAGLIESLQTGKFQPSPCDPVGEGENIVGELNDMEKAIFSGVETLRAKVDAAVDFYNKIIRDAEKKYLEVDETQISLVESEYQVSLKIMEGLSAVLWYSVKKRIGTLDYERSDLGIREGWKVVSF